MTATYLPVIPMVCAHCGKEGTFSEVGSVAISADGWRDLEVIHNGISIAFTLGSLEFDVDDPVELEDAYTPSGFSCFECGYYTKEIEDLAVPAFGVDRLGRILDRDGLPHGPIEVHPEQIALAL